MLAYEAHDAGRSHRATAERALHDEAAVAAWELLALVHSQVDGPATAVLSPVTGVRAASPYEALPPAASLAPAAARALPCPDSAANAARLLFRLDLRDGAFTSSPLASSGGALGAPSPDPRFVQWVRTTVANDVEALYRPEWRFAAVFGPPPFTDRAIVYAVKYAEHQAPIAAFGFSSCSDAFRPIVSSVMERRPLLPASVTGGTRSDSLFSVVVVAPGGETLYRSAATPTVIATAEATLPALSGLTARVALLPGAMTHLALGAPPRSRLPMLVGLLALTAGLIAVAILQIRREQELSRLRTDFVSSVSHELRTPLSQILLFAETLRLGRVRSEAERREAADVIVQEARRLGQLVDNVLHVSRAERGLATVRLEDVAVAPLVREVAEAWQAMGGAPALRLALDESATAHVDRGALRQMLFNLLENAAKYGPREQTITVGLATTLGRARLWVDDEGPGIPPGARARIFEPFFRLPRDVAAATAGSGIGLFVVRELAELQGATVEIDSSPSGGSRFVLTLASASGAPERSGVSATAQRADAAP